jgi:hypothetical protein
MRGILIASALACVGGVAAAQPATVTTTTTTTTTTTVSFDPPVATPAEVPPQAPAPARTAPADRRFRFAVAVGPARGFDLKDPCDGSCMGGGVDLHVGFAFRPRFLAVLDLDAMTHVESSRGYTHHAETLGVQWWAMDRLWLQLGVGVGSPRTPMDLGDTDADQLIVRGDLVPATSAAVGYEAIVFAHQSLGVQLRYAGSIADPHHTAYLSLLVGAAFN